MEQIGTVVKTENQDAVISVKRVSACGENCAHCKGGCTPTKAEVKVQNGIGAKAGDVVKVETNTASVIKAAVFLYFTPCLAAIIGAIVAECILSYAAVTVGVAAVLFFLAFFVIQRLDKKLAPASVITKIISSSKDEV